MDELQKKLDELKEQLEKAATEKAKAEIAAQIKELEEKLKKDFSTDDIKKDVEEIKQWKVKKDEADEKNQAVIDKVVADGNTVSTKNVQTKTFNQILAEGIEKHAQDLQNMSPGQYSKSNPLRIDLMPEVKAEGSKPREVKTVGDMSFSANFTGGSTYVQDVRQSPMIMRTQNLVWVGDLLPQGTTTGQSVIYPKENGGEGGAAAWTDYTAEKAQMDFDLTTQTAYLKWIAGWAVADREMLDDISWFSSWLQSKMLISLKTAENNAILNGIGGTNPLVGLNASATAYGPSGTFTRDIEKIIDAAYGQIVEDTDSFYQGNLAIVMPREKVRLGLTLAAGSGEFDLPNGVAWNNGNLTLGFPCVGTTAVGEGNAIVLDTAATLFIRRMQPELRVFEDSTLAKKNKIMFRIEERITLAIFNNSAIVAIDVSSS